MPFYILEAHKKPYEKFADGSTQEIDVPYDIPDTWEWVRLGRAISLLSGRDLNKSNYFDGKVGDTPYITGASNFSNGLVNTNRYTNHPTVLSYKGDLLITVKGTIGELAFNYFQKAHIARQIMAIQSTHLNLVFLKYQLQQLLPNIKLQAQSMIPGISRGTLLALLIPLPPLSEQQRIVEAIESALEKVDEYAESYNRLEQLDKEFPDKLKKSILQYAMQGKLVDQDPNDESVEVLLEKIRAEKQKLFDEGKIKKKDLEISIVSQGDDNSYYEEVPYEIPKSWEWVRFSTLVEIVRGGSPRPIKDYLTSEVDGINWIKIGDTEKGEKYINNVKEKIKKSGLNKTRFVKKGTFLLTNSMSFGRPYILNVDGAIHDGWLAISNYENSLNRDYLFYILSSNVVYSQFLSLISGAVVKNLNSDKVASILIPLPPLSEQTRIVDKIEQSFAHIDALI